MKKYIYVAIALAGIAVLYLGSRLTGHDEPVHDVASATTITAAIGAARVEQVAAAVEIGGTVRARTTATIASRIVGEVLDVKVSPGDRVRAGQPLVVLGAGELQASAARARASLTATEQALGLATAERDAARAALALARATHRRISDLHARKSATPHELDEVVAGLEAAEARHRGAELRVAEASASIEAARAGAQAASVSASYTVLPAPFDGIVTEKLIERGNMAAPGTPLLQLEDTRAFRLEVRVDQSGVGSVEVGQPVEVLIDAASGQDSPARAVGRVAEVAHALDAGAHAFVVKIDLPPDLRVRSNMFGRARFTGASRPALVVPADSVVRRGQVASVYVVDDAGQARIRMVSTGELAEAGIEIRAGLDDGERVVRNPPVGLADGTMVRERAVQVGGPADREAR